MTRFTMALVLAEITGKLRLLLPYLAAALVIGADAYLLMTGEPAMLATILAVVSLGIVAVTMVHVWWSSRKRRKQHTMSKPVSWHDRNH